MKSAAQSPAPWFGWPEGPLQGPLLVLRTLDCSDVLSVVPAVVTLQPEAAEEPLDL